MSVTYGFFNSVNHDRQYDADQWSAIFNGVINDGIFGNIGDAFKVSSSSSMTVSVGIGRAWFNSRWINNDAILLITIADAESILNRIDSVIIEINTEADVRACSIKLLTGTPASTAVAPTLTNTETIHQYRLADISVAASVTEITNSDITNYIGQDDCPYITGILETVDNTAVVQKWESQFTAWFSKMKDQLDQDAAGHLQNEIDAHHTDHDFTISTTWLDNTSYGDTSTYPYYQSIASDLFTDESHPDCLVFGADPSAFMTSDEDSAKGLMCGEVSFSTSGIIVLAMSATETPLTLRVRGV
jgi:hypothetical protein